MRGRDYPASRERCSPQIFCTEWLSARVRGLEWVAELRRGEPVYHRLSILVNTPFQVSLESMEGGRSLRGEERK